MLLLFLSFFITAILYASVGFGGGSTYNALLILAETNYLILPSIALICNIIVVSGGTYSFAKQGYMNITRIAPWVISSVPAAFFGGSINVSETIFIGLLGFTLLIAGVRMLFTNKKSYLLENIKIPTLLSTYILPVILGAILGLLAGIVGIGGGIFLAPLLYFLGWGKAKEIAATCSVFILFNSIAGLAGQSIKLNDANILIQITEYWRLFIAVLIGGQIGSWLGSKKLNPKTISNLTATLILYVAIKLIVKWSSISF